MKVIERITGDRVQARSLSDPNADVCFLAIAEDGVASIRTLVVREIDGNRFTLFINRSSPKFRALANGASYEMLLWYQTLQRQYRVSGTFEEHDRSIIESNWYRRPKGSKFLDYVYEEMGDQSTFIDSRETLMAKIDELKVRWTEEHFDVPEKAVGVVLVANRVEMLDLNDKDRIHDRRLYTLEADGKWSEQVMIP